MSSVIIKPFKPLDYCLAQNEILQTQNDHAYKND